MVERPNDESAAAPRSEPDTGPDPVEAPQLPAAGLGPRVTAVFTAAEQAADHILKMAREEVTDLRRRTEADLEAFRREQRVGAEEEAREMLSAARAEAESIRREATMAAAALEEAARTREQWVAEGIRLVLERAEWGRRGLDEVVSRLEPLVNRAPQEWAELPSEPLPAVTEPALAEPPPPDRGANGDRAHSAASAEPEGDAAAETPAAAEGEAAEWRPWRRSAAD